MPNSAAHEILKFIHVLGVVILIGNVTVTAFWKVFADRTENPSVVAYGQRLVTLTEFFFTLTGIALILIGGYGMIYVAGLDPLQPGWLVEGQLLFLLSGLIWLVVLVPIQIRQARAARRFENGGTIPDSYWGDGRRWLIWGVVATVFLVRAVYVMIAKY